MSAERFNATSQRCSRKERPCDWCNERIAVGERYSHYFGEQKDGPPAAFDSHLECDEAITREYDYVGWGEFHYRGKTTQETEDLFRERCRHDR